MPDLATAAPSPSTFFYLFFRLSLSHLLKLFQLFNVLHLEDKNIVSRHKSQSRYSFFISLHTMSVQHASYSSDDETHSSLPRLVPEILLMIFEYFGVTETLPLDQVYDPWWLHEDQQGRKTLLSLCRTSRQFCELAQPMLFSVYVKTAPPNFRKPRSTPNIPLRRFLRTMMEDKKNLASAVKTLAIRRWITPGFSIKHNLDPSPPSPDEVVARLNAIASVAPRFTDNNDFIQRWTSGLAMGAEDAEVALLLALTPALHHLFISLPKGDTPGGDCVASLFSLSLRKTSTPPVSYTHLTLPTKRIV